MWLIGHLTWTKCAKGKEFWPRGLNASAKYILTLVSLRMMHRLTRSILFSETLSFLFTQYCVSVLSIMFWPRGLIHLQKLLTLISLHMLCFIHHVLCLIFQIRECFRSIDKDWEVTRGSLLCQNLSTKPGFKVNKLLILNFNVCH